jgi:hypothetical protein
MQNVAEHAFMFRRLPESQRDPAASSVIQLFVDAVLQASSCLPAACRSQMHAMLQKWQGLRQDGAIDSAAVEQALARLGPNDTFALDVAAQNAALVVTVDADGATAVVKVLQIHSSNNLTTANNGNLSAVYPGAAVRVPIARVRGQALALQVRHKLQ